MSETPQAILETDEQGVTLSLEGDLEAMRRGAVGTILQDLAARPGAPIALDLRGVERIKGVGALMVRELVSRLEDRGHPVRILTADETQRRILSSLGREPEAPEPAESVGFDLVDRLGERTIRVQDAALDFLDLLRRSLAATARQFLGTKTRRNATCYQSVLRMGAHATPLVAMIAGLIGFILALQTAPILQKFGQEIRVAYLVGVSITREIGPLLTAILVAGRSGSSLTAEIGTMKVSEEVDALEVMGVDPVDYLVAPRLRALIIALPVLTIVADVVGIMGGLVVATTIMDLSSETYLSETITWLEVRDVVGGLLKAASFGVVIVSVAAHQGFSTAGGASGVGRFTTRSVVRAIVWIIVVDAIFTAVLYAMES